MPAGYNPNRLLSKLQLKQPLLSIAKILQENRLFVKILIRLCIFPSRKMEKTD